METDKNIANESVNETIKIEPYMENNNKLGLELAKTPKRHILLANIIREKI